MNNKKDFLTTQIYSKLEYINQAWPEYFDTTTNYQKEMETLNALGGENAPELLAANKRLDAIIEELESNENQ